MDVKRKSALSAGILIADMLREEDPDGSVIGGVIPVMASEEETLPYVVYAVTAYEVRPDKTPGGAVTAKVELRVYSENYEANIEAAEAVRRAMDFRKLSEDREDGLILRDCIMTGAQNAYEADAYVTIMEFTMKI